MSADRISDAVHRSIASAPTLKAALECFVTLTSIENKSESYSIINVGLDTRISKHTSILSISAPIFYNDLDFFIDLTFIIKRFAGRAWRPKRIAFQSGPPRGGFMSVYFPRTHVYTHRPCSWMELPRSLLPLHKRSGRGPATWGHTFAALDEADFFYALKCTLRKHLSEGYPDLEYAAEAMHTSVRTLQRYLARVGMTYSRVVEYVRFEVAVEMLCQPSLKIIDIAYSLGYQDPSHFSRAFRRIARQTPSEFRKTHTSKASSL